MQGLFGALPPWHASCEMLHAACLPWTSTAMARHALARLLFLPFLCPPQFRVGDSYLREWTKGEVALVLQAQAEAVRNGRVSWGVPCWLARRFQQPGRSCCFVGGSTAAAAPEMLQPRRPAVPPAPPHPPTSAHSPRTRPKPTSRLRPSGGSLTGWMPQAAATTSSTSCRPRVGGGSVLVC